MRPIKTIIFILLILITVTAHAEGPLVATSCVKADITGTWTAVINDTGSNSTERCTLVVNSAGNLTSGSCSDLT